MSEQDWYRTARRKVLIDNHLDDWLPGYEKYDSVKIADTIAGAGFEAGMIYARCHVGTCYWNASDGPKHRGLGEHDQIGELTQLLHERGLKMLLYYSTIYDKKMHDAHPDWRIVGESHGELSSSRASRYKQVCPNSPYRAYTVKCLEEIAERYEIDGAFLDMTFWSTVCHCPHCQKAWAEASGGKAIPAENWDDRDWKDFVAWRYDVITSFIKACADALHKHRPDIVVSFQCPNQITNTWMRGDDIDVRGSGAIPSHDVYYPSGHIQLSLQPRLFQATCDIHPFDVFISRPVLVLTDMPSMKPFVHMLAETCEVLANGGAVIYIDQIHPDGSLYPDHWDQFKRLNAEIERRQPFCGGEPAPYAAVYFSQDTRDYYANNDLGDKFLQSFAGACKALQESHIPFDIITPLNLDTIGKYRVIVLPNTVCLGQDEVDALKAFVAAGGGVVGTYQTSFCNARNEPYPQPALADVFGVRAVGDTRHFSDTYFRVCDDEHPVTRGMYTSRPVTSFKAQTLVETTGDAEALARVVYPYIEPHPDRYVSIHNNPPGVETARPAIVANSYGTGRAVYFSFPAGAMYATVSYWEAKVLLANAVRWAANAPAPAELDAPLCVELTVWDQPDEDRRVFHIINVQSDIGRTIATYAAGRGAATGENLHVIQEILPVRDIMLRFRIPEGKTVQRVMLQPSGLELEPEMDGDWAAVRVPEVWVHEAVVAEWSCG